ncbi:unnamed protein product [Ranitomeya imitator]|uniref:Cytochrome P450 n=1 Tax=Ranitomeya imitator TaxID=111125 RepID=A0ABN9KRL2_9NEOB|nr:unnamed protein product [Ranitomeya imitator]
MLIQKTKYVLFCFTERVQDEIKTHIKPGQLPTVEDRKKMPYTDAVIHEIQRFGNIVPLNVSHSTPSDVYFHGYLIPKGTEVIPFLTSVLYDKTQWKTPYDFNPNHFLDENGKFVRPDAFMPFSVASRTDCVSSAGRKAEHSGDVTAVLCFTAGAYSQCREADVGGRDRHRNEEELVLGKVWPGWNFSFFLLDFFKHLLSVRLQEFPEKI